MAAKASGVGIADGRHVAGVDTEQLELVTHVLTERIVADLGEHRRAVAEPCRGNGDIGRAAADRLRERLRIA